MTDVSLLHGLIHIKPRKHLNFLKFSGHSPTLEGLSSPVAKEIIAQTNTHILHSTVKGTPLFTLRLCHSH